MTVYSFDIHCRVEDEDIFADRLYDAGGDDATIAVHPDGHLAEVHFDRDSSDLRNAIVTALSAVQAAGGTPVRVGPDDLVWAAEIAERIGKTREYVRLLIAGQRGPGNWPLPVVPTARNPLWRWSDVAAWFTAWTDSDTTIPTADDEAATIAAVNGILEVLDAISRSPDPKSTRQFATTLLERAS